MIDGFGVGEGWGGRRHQKHNLQAKKAWNREADGKCIHIELRMDLWCGLCTLHCIYIYTEGECNVRECGDVVTWWDWARTGRPDRDHMLCPGSKPSANAKKWGGANPFSPPPMLMLTLDEIWHHSQKKNLLLWSDPRERRPLRRGLLVNSHGLFTGSPDHHHHLIYHISHKHH